jgi:hypothetical protein
MRPIGFSTGAVAKGDFRRALGLLRAHNVDIVELSALRLEELTPLAVALPDLGLDAFSFVSLHAPSRFDPAVESSVIDRLYSITQQGYPVVVHPDVIFTAAKWGVLGSNLLIENMDRRKPTGRTVREMQQLFELLPDARFCFDIGHARQVDPSMTEAWLLLHAFAARLAEVHISEVNTSSRHDPISRNAVIAFRSVAQYIPEHIPIILEPLIDRGQSDIDKELQSARDALRSMVLAVT